MTASAIEDIATSADAAMAVLAFRFCAAPGLVEPASGDIIAFAIALLAGLALVVRSKLQPVAKPLDIHTLAVLNHELRTPLNAIMGFSGLLRSLSQQGACSCRCQDYARIIEAGGEHMLAVLEATIGAKAAPQTAKTDATVDLDDAIAECLELLAPLAANRAVTLRYRQTARRIEAVGDRGALRQILINLIANAVKFSPAGSTVQVSIRRRPNGRLEIAVADQGVGIEAADLAMLGRPYRRGAQAMRQKIEGSGLGLAISRRLAEQHGGSLQLDSQAGHGTTARLELAEHEPRQFLPRPLGPQARTGLRPHQSGTAINPMFAIGGP